MSNMINEVLSSNEGGKVVYSGSEVAVIEFPHCVIEIFPSGSVCMSVKMGVDNQ